MAQNVGLKEILTSCKSELSFSPESGVNCFDKDLRTPAPKANWICAEGQCWGICPDLVISDKRNLRSSRRLD